MKSLHTCIWIAAFVWAASCADATAQSVLTSRDAVARALANHPRLEASTARIEAEQGLVKQAGLRPNPRLYLQSENWNPGNPPQPIASTFTDQFLYASQLLETAGKRQWRVNVTQAGTRIAETNREITALQIASRVKLAYWGAVGAQRVVDLLRENQQTLERSVEYHSLQLKEGAIPEADLVRVKLEEERGQVALESAVRESDLALVTLFREMGETAFPDVRLEEASAPESSIPVANVDEALASRPDVLKARQTVARAQANLGLQKAGARPDLEVLAGYKRTAGFNTFMWGAQIALPLANRNQGNIASAIGEMRAAQAEAVATEAQTQAEVEAARRDVDSRHRQLENLMRDSLARANEMVEIARAAYREGGVDLLRLLDAERTHIETEVLNARLVSEYRQSLVVLESVTGGSR